MNLEGVKRLLTNERKESIVIIAINILTKEPFTIIEKRGTMPSPKHGKKIQTIYQTMKVNQAQSNQEDDTSANVGAYSSSNAYRDGKKTINGIFSLI